jgi:hypothetical protein
MSGAGHDREPTVAHVAERFHLFPEMGRGMLNSVGHYLDLTSGVLRCVLLALSLVAYALRLLFGAAR